MKKESKQKSNLASWGKIWSIAWPHSIENILFTLLLLVDLYWVGNWGGDDPINAVAIVGPVIWTIHSASLFVFYGMLSLISRCVGSGDKKSATLIGHQGLLVGLTVGGTIGIVGILCAHPLLRLYKTSVIVHEMAVDYMVILFMGIPIFYLYMAMYAVFSAHSNTKDPMLLTLIAWVVNFALDPLLIYGWHFVPAMGIRGAAWASLVSYVVAFVGFLIFFQKPMQSYTPITGIGNFKPRWAIIKEIIRIGTPASINGFSRPLSAMILMGIVAMYGKEVVAAFGIAVRIVSVNWIYLGGLNIAVASLVGQNLGAHSIQGAQRTVFKTWLLGNIFQVLFTGFLVIFSNELVALFTPSASTIDEASYLLVALALGTLADVYIAVYGGALNGAGDTVKAMASSVLANWIFKLPLSYMFFCLYGFTAIPIYWVVAISLPVEGIANYLWYLRGSWKTKALNVKHG
jgi:putative MATE family efflux protein